MIPSREVKQCDKCGVRLTSREAEKMGQNQSIQKVVRLEDFKGRGVEDYFTYAEIGFLCRRSPGHIRNLVSLHRIPHVRARGPWPEHRLALVPAVEVRRLRKIILGI